MRCAAGLSDSFPVKVGIHQDSALSPLLFILILDTIMKELQCDIPWTLLYADDVMLAAATREKLQQYVQTWNNRLSQLGLLLNLKKT